MILYTKLILLLKYKQLDPYLQLDNTTGNIYCLYCLDLKKLSKNNCYKHSRIKYNIKTQSLQYFVFLGHLNINASMTMALFLYFIQRWCS